MPDTLQTQIQLVDCAKWYRQLPHQEKALQELENKLKLEILSNFAKLWRDSVDSAPIRLTLVFDWYRGLAHQDHALQWLQSQLTSEELDAFATQWRSAPNPKKTVAIPPKKTDIRLAIRWDAQTNSRYKSQANRMCFSSSIWMAVSYVSKRFATQFKTDDDYLAHMLKFGDTVDSSAHLAALQASGYSVQYTQQASPKDIVASLESGLPVAIGILHHGSHLQPTQSSGHWLTIGGVNAQRNQFLAFDPWGSIMTAGEPYSGAVELGNGYHIPDWVLMSRWEVDGPSTGWAMFFKGN